LSPGLNSSAARRMLRRSVTDNDARLIRWRPAAYSRIGITT
jgi:hypothetical protein